MNRNNFWYHYEAIAVDKLLGLYLGATLPMEVSWKYVKQGWKLCLVSLNWLSALQSWATFIKHCKMLVVSLIL